MTRIAQTKFGEIWCQVGVYIMTTIIIGQFLGDLMPVWLSVLLVSVSILFIAIGLIILNGIKDEEKKPKRYNNADITINNAVIKKK